MECRYCYEVVLEVKKMCNCTGAVSYVHEHCIKSWMRVSGRTKCEFCLASFVFFAKEESPLSKESMYFFNATDDRMEEIRFLDVVNSLWLPEMTSAQRRAQQWHREAQNQHRRVLRRDERGNMGINYDAYLQNFYWSDNNQPEEGVEGSQGVNRFSGDDEDEALSFMGWLLGRGALSHNEYARMRDSMAGRVDTTTSEMIARTINHLVEGVDDLTLGYVDVPVSHGASADDESRRVDDILFGINVREELSQLGVLRFVSTSEFSYLLTRFRDMRRPAQATTSLGVSLRTPPPVSGSRMGTIFNGHSSTHGEERSHASEASRTGFNYYGDVNVMVGAGGPAQHLAFGRLEDTLPPPRNRQERRARRRGDKNRDPDERRVQRQENRERQKNMRRQLKK